MLGAAVAVTRPPETVTSLPNLQLPSGDVAISFLTDPGNLSVHYVDNELITVSRTRLTYAERSGSGPQFVPFPSLPSAPVRFVADPSNGAIAVVTIGTSPTRILESRRLAHRRRAPCVTSPGGRRCVRPRCWTAVLC